MPDPPDQLTRLSKTIPLGSSPEDELKLGQWFWVDSSSYSRLDKSADDDGRWLGCITHIGSNYAQLQSVPDPNGGYIYTRAHFDHFDEICKPEPNAAHIIETKVTEHRQTVRELTGEIQRVTASLAITPRKTLATENDTQALVLRSASGPSIKDYKKQLLKAKNKTLPLLFAEIRHHNEQMAAWMKAPLIPLKAEASELEPVIELIESRVRNVELYAGLVEDVKHIQKGLPAQLDEKIRLFQRRAYMDEECLVNYKAGGMEFKTIGSFDKWLLQPDNLNRLLPFPRCIIAFQVRRKEKQREIVNLDDYIKIVFGRIADADKLTFLYLRNGENVYRLNTELHFGDQLFPDIDRSSLTGMIYANVESGSVKRVCGEHEYQGMLEDDDRRSQNLAAAKDELRKKKIPENAWHEHLSHLGYSRFRGDPKRESDTYKPWTRETVYYDDIEAFIKDEMDHHNRVVLILQGLLDRSQTFHPHPPWQLWNPESFSQAIELIFDDSRALVSGPPPDFEAYRAELNALLKVGSITVGQDDAWTRREAERENERRSRNWRLTGEARYYHHQHYRPSDDPRPGDLAFVKAINKQTCTYRWTRRQRTYSRYDQEDRHIRCSLQVPKPQLLNVSAYQQGDFKQFYNDPRTRADYLQWAPLLLEAEEWYAGNRKIDGKKYRR
jgi:hypothetical protein